MEKDNPCSTELRSWGVHVSMHDILCMGGKPRSDNRICQIKKRLRTGLRLGKVFSTPVVWTSQQDEYGRPEVL
jgi:hypothetical protein